LAAAQAEGAGQLDFILQIVAADQLPQFFYNVTGTLNVAGTADTYRNFHHDNILSI
jgi:hypothetical protein